MLKMIYLYEGGITYKHFSPHVPIGVVFSELCHPLVYSHYQAYSLAAKALSLWAMVSGVQGVGYTFFTAANQTHIYRIVARLHPLHTTCIHREYNHTLHTTPPTTGHTEATQSTASHQSQGHRCSLTTVSP